MPVRAHQMTATLAFGDAVGNDILEIDRRLRRWGFDSHIYAEHFEPRMAHLVQPDRAYASFLGETEDVLIYHYSVYSANLELFRRSRNRKIVIYHNITPPEFFQSWDRGLANICRTGRQALPVLRSCDLALADSEFNRCELVEAGIPAERTGVLPIFLSLDKFAGARRNLPLYRRLCRGRDENRVNLLYVGRIAPNKGCDDLLKIFQAYRHNCNPQAHLYMVGYRFLPSYARYLDELAGRLGIADAITFADRVSLGDLRTYYEASDVFLYASRHEGFGVPLVESMHFGLPVLAYDCTAVQETLGMAGILYRRFAYAEIAEMLHVLATDAGLRDRLAARGRERLSDFDPVRVEETFRQALCQVGVLR